MSQKNSFLTLTKPAQLIITNANIITVDPKKPRAAALAVQDDRILAVGSDDEISALKTAGTKQLDMGGRTILPGFIDAHCHVLTSGLLHLHCVNCDLRSIPAIQQAIRKRAQQTPPGEW